MYTATFRLLKVLKPKLQSHRQLRKLAESVSHTSEPQARAEINCDGKKKNFQWYVSRMHIKRLPNSKMHVCSLFGYTELECFECVAFRSSLPFFLNTPTHKITCTLQDKPCKTINIFSQPLDPPKPAHPAPQDNNNIQHVVLAKADLNESNGPWDSYTAEMPHFHVPKSPELWPANNSHL